MKRFLLGTLLLSSVSALAGERLAQISSVDGDRLTVRCAETCATIEIEMQRRGESPEVINRLRTRRDAEIITVKTNHQTMRLTRSFFELSNNTFMQEAVELNDAKSIIPNLFFPHLNLKRTKNVVKALDVAILGIAIAPYEAVYDLVRAELIPEGRAALSRQVRVARNVFEDLARNIENL
jgi:hypothetical protein